MSNSLFETQIRRHLAAIGVNSDIISLSPLSRIGNNRMYRVQTKEQTFAVKQYFRHPHDTRDRLSAEFSFLTYAYTCASHYVPKPYHKDNDAGLALFEFIEGKTFLPHEADQAAVEQAIDFFHLLNRSAHDTATHLANAAESCFSLNEHLRVIERRTNDLQHISLQSDEDYLAKKYIAQLALHWETLQKKIRKEHQKSIDRILDPKERCISPSDFGFHNALRVKNNHICFLDFEYAGWDDPAKLIGDFFCQLSVPVPREFFGLFMEKIAILFPDPEKCIARAKLLFPLYQIKWCYIALNIFVPIHLARRQFSHPELDVHALKKAQLTKIESLLPYLENTYAAY